MMKKKRTVLQRMTSVLLAGLMTFSSFTTALADGSVGDVPITEVTTEADAPQTEAQTPETQAQDTQAPETKDAETQAAATEAQTPAPATEAAKADEPTTNKESETLPAETAQTEAHTEKASETAVPAEPATEKASETAAPAEPATEKASETAAPAEPATEKVSETAAQTEPATEKASEKETEVQYAAAVPAAQAGAATVTLANVENAKLPVDTALHVEEAGAGSAVRASVDSLIDATFHLDGLKENSYVTDISLISPAKGGIAVEPTCPVTVTISFASPVLTNHKAGVSSYKVYHVVNGVLQDTNAQVGVNADGSVSSLTFTTPSFSPFAIVADPAQYSAILTKESESTAASESESTAAAESEAESTRVAESEAESTRVAESEAESTRVAESEAESTRVAESEAESTRVAESESESERIAEYEDESQKESESESERLAEETESEAETESEKIVAPRRVIRRTRSTGSADLSSFITSVTATANTDSGKVTIKNGETSTVTLKETNTVDFSLDFYIPAGQLPAGVNSVTYQLPTNIQVYEEVTDRVFTNSKGVQIGTYSLTKTGQLTMTFNDNVMTQYRNGSPITDGKFTFSTEVGKISSDSHTEKQVKFGEDYTFTFPFNETPKTTNDLHVEKRELSKDISNGTVTYAVDVYSEYGTNNTVVNFLDTMNNLMVDENTTVEISTANETNPSAVSDVSRVQFPKNGDKIFATLPPMHAGEKYTITYTAKLPAYTSNVDASNTATVTSKDNNGFKLQDSDTVNTKFKTVSKTGYLGSDGKVYWTITVNEAQGNIAGWSLNDTLYGRDSESGEWEEITIPEGTTVTVTPKLNGTAGNENITSWPVVFPAISDGENHTTYTFKYSTDVTDDTKKYLNNKAVITNPSGGSSSSESGSINTNPGTSTNWNNKKQLVKAEPTADNLYVILHYHLDINFASFDDKNLSSWTLRDWLNNEDDPGFMYQWFSDKQKTEIETVVKSALNAAGFDPNKITFTWTPSSDNISGHYKEFVVKCDQSPKSRTKDIVSLDYFATGYNRSSTVRNSVQFEKDNTVYDFKYKQPKVSILKYDISASADAQKAISGDSTHYTSDLHVTDTISWLVKVNNPDGYNGDLVVTENIPEGLTDIEILTGKAANEVQNDFKWIEKGGLQNTTGYSVTHNGNVYTIKIPANVVSYIEQQGGSDTFIKVSGKLDRNWLNEHGLSTSNTLFKYNAYSNSATVSDADGHKIGTASQTQTIVNDGPSKILSKSGKQLEGNNRVDYSVTINPNAMTFGSGNTITLTDILSAKGGKQQDIDVQLVPGSVKVENPNDSTEKIDFSYTYDESKTTDNNQCQTKTNTLTLTIPNGRALTLKYAYNVKIKDGTQGTSLTLNNTASLSGAEGTIATNSASVTVQYQTTGASANVSSGGITLYKVDADNQGKYLNGAWFALYQY